MNMILSQAMAFHPDLSAVAVLTRAFAGDPVARWMYPEDADYFRHFPTFIGAFAGKAFAYGTTDEAPEEIGAALWLPPMVEPDDLALARVIDATLSRDKADTVFAMMGEMERHHPSVPHWYLPLIGVDPRAQGMGIGTALLRPALARCDRQRVPAYLEASSDASRRLYQRLGFETVGTIQVASSPPLHPMVREPRP